MPGRVDMLTRKKRSRKLRELSSIKRYKFHLKHIGKQSKVLFETLKEGGIIYGFTGNYIKVKTLGNKDLENEIIDVKLTEINEDNIVSGELAGI
jgi:threonylcarbamoyladenosine tRNA methylthiotransferase MtaB